MFYILVTLVDTVSSFFKKDVAKITDEVYMEVVVGGEDPGSAQRTLDNSSLSKDFMPVAWAAAYG